MTTIITGVVVACFAAFANIEEMVDLTNIGTLFAFALVSAGVIVLRRTNPTAPRPFRVPLVPWLPLAAMAACLLLAAGLPAVTWVRFGLWLTGAWCSTCCTDAVTPASPGRPRLTAG